MLELKGITVKAGSFLLKGIDLNVEEQRCHAIIGPTGCGKTTLLETVIGLRKPTRGEIWLHGKEISSLPVESRGISYLPQDLALFPHLNVRKNINYGARVCKAKDRKPDALVSGLIERLGVAHLLERSVHNLSGGERQRVALIRAMATGNKYLLLDEPLSSLHEAMKKELWLLIKKLQKQYGLTIIMVTHDLEEAFFLGDTISVMIDGRIYQTGTKDEVYRFPATLEVAGFFGIRNLYEAEVINSAKEGVIVRCKDLNVDLNLTTDKFTGLQNKEVTIGIRAEDVMFYRPDLKRQDQDNTITGTIAEIFRKGATTAVYFVPNGTQKNIEIELPDYAMQKLNLAQGQISTVFLKSERIFTVIPGFR